jgi:hypothetical protein
MQIYLKGDAILNTHYSQIIISLLRQGVLHSTLCHKVC